MEQNHETNSEVVAEFKKRKTRQLIATAPFMLALFSMFMLEDAGPEGLFGIPSSVMVPIFIIFAIGIFIFSFSNWRCPACNSYLGKAMSPKFCQKCGAKLQA